MSYNPFYCRALSSNAHQYKPWEYTQKERADLISAWKMGDNLDNRAVKD